jgi:hypothetical protein
MYFQKYTVSLPTYLTEKMNQLGNFYKLMNIPLRGLRVSLIRRLFDAVSRLIEKLDSKMFIYKAIYSVKIIY